MKNIYYTLFNSGRRYIRGRPVHTASAVPDCDRVSQPLSKRFWWLSTAASCHPHSWPYQFAGCLCFRRALHP